MYDIPPPARSGASFDTAAALNSILPAANALVATPDARPDIPSTYRLAGCHASNPADKNREVSEACLFVRSGACAPVGEQLAAFEINQLLRRILSFTCSPSSCHRPPSPRRGSPSSRRPASGVHQLRAATSSICLSRSAGSS